jgi:hypothetical protein
MGFNPIQRGRVKPSDMAVFLIALGVIAALVVWAIS